MIIWMIANQWFTIKAPWFYPQGIVWYSLTCFWCDITCMYIYIYIFITHIKQVFLHTICQNPCLYNMRNFRATRKYRHLCNQAYWTTTLLPGLSPSDTLRQILPAWILLWVNNHVQLPIHAITHLSLDKMAAVSQTIFSDATVKPFNFKNG